MTPERWQKVKQICFAVLDREPDERAAALQELCAGDSELQRDVEVMMADACRDETVYLPASPRGVATPARLPPLAAFAVMNQGTGDDTTRLTSQDRVPASGVPARAGAAGYRLVAGTPLGPYTIVGPIGVGGMGEVYAARDSALKRDVAIKILPRDLATNTDRLARFRREAQVLASLNHPNVAAIYGLHDAGDMLALVMELVEGETLAERIARGPLPVKEVIGVAQQIAEALASAHEQGIVHRDLKPANIKIRPDDQVKVLDFGLAKALDPRSGMGSGDRRDGSGSDEYLTATGIVVGTGPYMAPEQVRGKALDRRADIWAFGVVCWEMLTGTRLFDGETLSDVLGAVLHTEPDWSQLPRETPPVLQRLLRRCLQKSPRMRLDSATAVRLDLQEALDGADVINDRPGRPWLPWAVAGVATAVALLVVLITSLSTPGTPTTHSAFLRADLGADISLRLDLGSAIALSPDGGTLVFASATSSVPSMLYVRRIDELDARPLDGTQNAKSPFFSPDGQWIGFFADKKLKRISASGGPAFDICEADDPRGGSWSDDGKWIVFAPEKAKPLVKVAATGGVPEPVTKFVSGELTHRWPQVLPGSRDVLYTSSRKTDEWTEAKLMVQSLSGGEPTVLQPGFYGRYVASGHLLFVQSGTLSAAFFDPQRHEPPGRAAAVVDNLAADPSTGGAQYAVADDGTLVFLQGRRSTKAVSVVWMARSGDTGSLNEAPLDWTNPQVSPTRDRLAFDVHDGRNRDIWILDLNTRQMTQLTFDAADDYKPIWTLDGERIVFTSTRNGAANLYWQSADGAGPVQRLTTSPNPQNAGSWHHSGKYLAYEELRPGTGKDIFILPFDKATPTPMKPVLFVGEPDNQAEPVFSPDGKWLAFHGATPKRTEVFVRSFEGEGQWQISTGGGRDAAWSPKSELLYFSTGDQRIMTARYSVSGNSFRHAQPVPWSVIPLGRPPRDGRTFHLYRDGERVVGVPRDPIQLTMIFDLFSRLRRIAPAAN